VYKFCAESQLNTNQPTNHLASEVTTVWRYPDRRRNTAARILLPLCHEVCAYVGMWVGWRACVNTIKRKPPIGMTWNFA